VAAAEIATAERALASQKAAAAEVFASVASSEAGAEPPSDSQLLTFVLAVYEIDRAQLVQQYTAGLGTKKVAVGAAHQAVLPEVGASESAERGDTILAYEDIAASLDTTGRERVVVSDRPPKPEETEEGEEETKEEDRDENEGKEEEDGEEEDEDEEKDEDEDESGEMISSEHAALMALMQRGSKATALSAAAIRAADVGELDDHARQPSSEMD